MPRKHASAERVDQALRDLFRAVAQRPIPDRLMSVIDQLDEPPQMRLKQKVG